MELRPIEKERWQVFIDELSRALQGNYVEIEVAGPIIGDQIEESWVPLSGLSYDPKEDVVFVHTEQFERAVHNPKEVVALQGDGMRVHSLVIKDAQGNVNTIKFRAPVLIEAASSAEAPSPAP